VEIEANVIMAHQLSLRLTESKFVLLHLR